MPNSIATARGHLRKSPTSQPHEHSQSVSALRRYHKSNAVKSLWKNAQKTASLAPFDPTTATKSSAFHFDYTGPLPERCASGTLYFMVSCHGGYIHIIPLTSLKGSCTAEAFFKTVTFFRSKGVVLDSARSDNQSSPEIKKVAATLNIKIMPVPAFQKQSNRAERAIQTAKHHMIAVRVGFHRDCPHKYLDMCVRTN
jgi:hypothetical protein